MLGHHQHASKSPFKWCYMAGQSWPTYSCIWILPPPHQLPKKREKKWSGTPMTKLSGSTHESHLIWHFSSCRPDWDFCCFYLYDKILSHIPRNNKWEGYTQTAGRWKSSDVIVILKWRNCDMLHLSAYPEPSGSLFWIWNAVFNGKQEIEYIIHVRLG